MGPVFAVVRPIFMPKIRRERGGVSLLFSGTFFIVTVIVFARMRVWRDAAGRGEIIPINVLGITAPD